MMIGALAPYETSLAGAGPLAMLGDHGDRVTLDVERYLGAVDAADETVLDRCRGPVLDVGCGPGRMVAALASRGIAALGVDIAPMAVELARSRGVAVLLRDVFARVPDEGRWPTALVVDGNVGIGGDVDRILGRLEAILTGDGRAVIETAPDPTTDRTLLMRFARGATAAGPQFAWSVIGADALAARAARVGFAVLGTWSASGRHFVELGHLESAAFESGAVGSGAVRSSRAGSGAVESSAVGSGAVESGAIESGAVESDGAEVFRRRRSA